MGKAKCKWVDDPETNSLSLDHPCGLSARIFRNGKGLRRHFVIVNTCDKAQTLFSQANLKSLRDTKQQAESWIENHSVLILWGAQPEDNEPQWYFFETLPELNAFMYGIEESSGWLDYEIVDGPENYVGTKW